MPSRFKRAHRTHGLDQPAGKPYPHLTGGQAGQRVGLDGRVLTLFAELCTRVPDPAKRADLLGVSAEVQAAWERGAALPLLRARRKTLERALQAANSGTDDSSFFERARAHPVRGQGSSHLEQGV
jgi:hypothetical protein